METFLLLCCMFSDTVIIPEFLSSSYRFHFNPLLYALQFAQQKQTFSTHFDCLSLIELFDFILFVGRFMCVNIGINWSQMETWEGNKS